MNNDHAVPPSQGSRTGAKGSVSPRDASRAILTILLTLAPIAALIWNTRARTSGVDFKARSGDWTRAWDDVAIGSGLAAFDSFPVAPYLVTNAFSRKGQVAFATFKETFGQLERANRARLSRPWEGFPAADLFPRRPRVAQGFDDRGRAFLLGWGFRLLGKVSPGLLFWLAPALTALVLLWIMTEASRAGWAVFGFVVSLLVAISSFCVDVLTLGYSAAGFYLVSILACLALGIGALGHRTTLPGLVGRSLIAGIVLALGVTARSVSWTVLPALLIISSLGAMRISAPRGRRVGAALGAAICLLSPTVLLRAHIADSSRRAADRFGGDAAPASHDIWITYWQGLGDFDRTHGDVFLDGAGLPVLREHGGRERVSERSEAIMRRIVMESIQAEPAWFARILVERTLSTVSFRKLWPRATAASPGFYPSTTPNEGATDSYWTMTDQADTVRLGSSRIEAPAILLPLALFGFFGAAFWKLRSPRSEDRVNLLRVVSLLVLAALPGPVATTTAGAFEPQSFVVAVFAALAGLFQLAAWAAADRGVWPAGQP